MNCKHSENLAAWLDGELSAAESDSLRVHLETCAECRVRLELLKRSSDALECIAAVEVPAGFAAKVKSRARARTLRPVYAFAAMAAAAAVVFAISVRVNFTSTVAPSSVTIDDLSLLELADANDADVVAEEMEIVESIEIPDDLDVTEGIELCWELESLEELEGLEIDAII